MMLGGYSRIGRRQRHGFGRGFRLNSRRFSVHRLRSRFVYLLKFLSGWKSSYGQAVQCVKRSMSRNSSIRRSRSSRRSLVSDCKMTAFGRSNSFYSEAIADCLDFIKRSSISIDEKQV